MATEMVLIPKARYERFINGDKELQDKVNYYEELLEKKKSNDNDNNEDSVSMSTDKSGTSANVLAKVKSHGSDTADARTPIKTISNPSIYPSPLTIFNQFDPKFTIYGKRLLGYIKKYGSNVLGWDDDAIILYKDRGMDGTNIVDMIEHIFKKS
jgi:hypothetical protein